MIKKSVGFIGAGQMAQALARGIVAAGIVSGERMFVADPTLSATAAFRLCAAGCHVLESNAAVAEEADVIVLATKPQVISGVAAELRGGLTQEKFVVSIAAGVTLSTLADGLAHRRIARVMPNTPCLVGSGASAFSLGSEAAEEDGQLLRRVLESVGLAFEVEERLLDAVTGLSGSGPAFVYMVIEALADGGVRMGLPREIAAALAAQTVRGSAEMVLTEKQHPAVLRDRVASPGGTTIAGLQALEDRGLRAALIAAVQSATLRAAELGETGPPPRDPRR